MPSRRTTQAQEFADLHRCWPTSTDVVLILRIEERKLAVAKRQVITIDEEKCTGCGKCVNACIGGALALVNGKAKLMREDYCDGLGVCVGECPVGALKVEEREVAGYTAPVQRHQPPSARTVPHACPGTANRQFERRAPQPGAVTEMASALTHWPIQLHLIRPDAPHYCGADILIAASCTAFACGGFHPELLAGKSLIIACPKLDNPAGYVEKLAELFAAGQPRSVTVARMEVPCCMGLVRMVAEARARAESGIPVTEVVVGLEGSVLSRREIASAMA